MNPIPKIAACSQLNNFREYAALAWLRSSCVVTICAFGMTAGAAAADLGALLAAAKPGETVKLPPGEYRGGVKLPAGVSVQGAGYGKTIIDGKGAEAGLIIEGGIGTTISDLTVRGARGTNILVQHSEQTSIRRVRATEGLIGIGLNGAKRARVENAVSDANRYGIVVTEGEGNVIVNCTLAGNTSVGLSFSSGKGMVAFNNCVTDSATDVFVGDHVEGVTLDHNLYAGLRIGKWRQELSRETLNDWRYISGGDAHSVSLSVQYEDPAAGSFSAINTLDWALDRVVTAGWGTASLAGVKAPTEDIEGDTWNGIPAVGAFGTKASVSPRPATGVFTVPAGTGLTSAGVFDQDGRLVDYLFQTLPLQEGEHRFWLPARAYAGQNIAAGNYEVRVLRSELDWKYLGWIGNTGAGSRLIGKPLPTWAISAVAFDKDGRFFVGHGRHEDWINIRGLDRQGEPIWSLMGVTDVLGLAVAGDGLLYALRPGETANEEVRLSRLNPATGDFAPWKEGDHGQYVLPDGRAYTGLAALGEVLCYTDTRHNAVRFGTTRSPEPSKAVSVPSPTKPAADAKSGVVWVISEGKKLVAVSPDGGLVAEAAPVDAPIALAAGNEVLAVASGKTRQVHLFDAAQPSTLKPLRTIGQGGDPAGRFQHDRFVFRTPGVELAMGPEGELAVVDNNHTEVFDKDGALLRSTYSVVGSGVIPSNVTPGRVYSRQMSAMVTFMADPEKGTWEVESVHPDRIAEKTPDRFLGDFQINGQTYLALVGYQHPKAGLQIWRFTPEKVTPLLMLEKQGESILVRKDANADGQIDDHDQAEPLLDESGAPVVAVRPLTQPRYDFILTNGEIISPSVEGWLTSWKVAGLDEKGVPILRWKNRVPLAGKDTNLLSPFDQKTARMDIANIVRRPGGGWVCLAGIYGSPAKSLFNNGGTDVVAVDKNGIVDWMRIFSGFPRVGCLVGGSGIYAGAIGPTADFWVMNDDGLGMPGFSFPEAAHHNGFWIDHGEAVSSFVDKQGCLNVLTADYIDSRHHWFRLAKRQEKTAVAKFSIGQDAADGLAALPAPTLDLSPGKPATPVVTIPRLKAPLPIDGSLEKWRQAGISPQIILTPENSMGISGAKDASALVRMAYEGDALYVQVLRFDDVVTTHQPHTRSYLQDTVEMCINGFLDGSKFNISQSSDKGPVIIRENWQSKLGPSLIDPNHAPRVIKEMNARDVAERKILEDIFGVDMSDSKVQLFEFKLPMDKTTYAGAEERVVAIKPGTEMWLGFMVDDNDMPGTDVQNGLIWPATYGTFNPKESGAKGVFE